MDRWEIKLYFIFLLISAILKKKLSIETFYVSLDLKTQKDISFKLRNRLFGNSHVVTKFYGKSDFFSCKYKSENNNLKILSAVFVVV